jgi:Family of unknown function (DUF6084)
MRPASVLGRTTPDLSFNVEDAGAADHAAVPTMRFALRIEAGGCLVRSILLQTQIQIAARRRRHEEQEEERLFELFGGRAHWGRSLRTLLWTRHTQVVPQFTGSTTVDLLVPCTYDFDVVASRYLLALDGGDLPLELLFSGTVFYAGENGMLQTAQLPSDREAEYSLPVTAWRDTMDRYFADTTWVRLRKGTFERLHAYRSRGALPSWEHAIDELLDGAG